MVSSSLAVRELPLFPLPEVVLFPGRPLPLHIFEFRYRIMTNTVLEGDRRFGVLLWDPAKQESARVGCCAEIIQVQRLPDDRINILTLGQQRFRVLECTRQSPYRVGLVEWVDDQTTDVDLQGLTSNVDQLLRDVFRLSAKLTGQTLELPNDIPKAPLELSYWVASKLYDVTDLQQDLLETQDTAGRLEKEAAILTATRNHLAARTVLKETFDKN